MTLSDSEEVGKLFVGGLSWESTKEKLHHYFSQFGEVVDCVVMTNNETGKPRGFGFVTFKDPACVTLVLSRPTHELDGRRIDPKACTPRSIQKAKRSGNFPKLFLGGLPPLCTETDIRNVFSEYGKVIDVIIMYDQEKKKTRGFGFLSFESEESVERLCSQRYVTFGNKQVECKRAESRDFSKVRSKHTLPSAHWGSAGMSSSGGWTGGQNVPSAQMVSAVPSGYQPGWGSQQVPYGSPDGYQQTSYSWSTSAAYGYSPYGNPSSNYTEQRYVGYAAMPSTGVPYGNYTTSVSTVPSAVTYPVNQQPQIPSTSEAVRVKPTCTIASSAPSSAVSESSAYETTAIPSYNTQPESTESSSHLRNTMPASGFTYGSYPALVSNVPSVVSYPISAPQSSFSSDALNTDPKSTASSSVTVDSVSHSEEYPPISIPSYSTQSGAFGSHSPLRSSNQAANYHPYRRI